MLYLFWSTLINNLNLNLNWSTTSGTFFDCMLRRRGGSLCGELEIKINLWKVKYEMKSLKWFWSGKEFCSRHFCLSGPWCQWSTLWPSCRTTLVSLWVMIMRWVPVNIIIVNFIITLPVVVIIITIIMIIITLISAVGTPFSAFPQVHSSPHPPPISSRFPLFCLQHHQFSVLNIIIFAIHRWWT